MAFTSPNSHPSSKTSGKVVSGSILLVLGIIIFFMAVFVPLMFENIFLMFPFFFGGFFIIIMGIILLIAGIRKKTLENAPLQLERMMERNLNMSNKIFGVNTTQQTPSTRYDAAYNTPISGTPQGNNSNIPTHSAEELICTFCGASNTAEKAFCIGCGVKLER